MLIPPQKTERVSRAAMRIYGLAGGTGCGKSEVARVFADSGIPVIGADAIGHELIASGGGAVEAVTQAFGDGILTGGVIDRAKLGALVFADPDARERLNAIVHPLIAEEIDRRCGSLADAGHPFVVIDAALLAEEGVKSGFLDGLVVVHCDREMRIRNLVENRGLTREEALQRMDAQTPPELKLDLADWVIENDGDLEGLRAQAMALAEELRDAD